MSISVLIIKLWRQDLYRGGGIISVTSRILVVDMLKADIPIELITGMLVMHAERWVSQMDQFKKSYPPFLYRVTPLVLEAFLVRLYREKNKTGFVKAFTDQPEHITSGLSPLKNIMKELQLRTVHIYPRCYSPVRILKAYSHVCSDFMKKLRHLLNDVEQMFIRKNGFCP